jgi:hypothetical protein
MFYQAGDTQLAYFFASTGAIAEIDEFYMRKRAQIAEVILVPKRPVPTGLSYTTP